MTLDTVDETEVETESGHEGLDVDINVREKGDP